VGGEYTGSIITLLESSPNEKRGFMANTANVTGSVGVMLASLVVTILTASMSEEAMLSYGWRLCFAVGALLSLSSLALRRYMHESPSFERIKNAHGILKEPLVETFRNHKLAMVYSFFLSTYLGASYYFVASYIPTYLETVVNYPKDTTMVITTIISVVMAFLPFLGGWASDKYGRRPVLLVSTILSFILVTPVLVLQRTQDVMGILFGQLVWAFIQITFAGGALPAVAEMFPSNVRFTALGLSYNLAHSLLVGTTPMICTALVQTTGNPLTPAGWIGTLAVVCVPVAWFMRETAWIDLDRE
jgi:MHS family proline/betaine transporter-like MFS transporter